MIRWRTASGPNRGKSFIQGKLPEKRCACVEPTQAQQTL